MPIFSLFDHPLRRKRETLEHIALSRFIPCCFLNGNFHARRIILIHLSITNFLFIYLLFIRNNSDRCTRLHLILILLTIHLLWHHFRLFKHLTTSFDYFHTMSISFSSLGECHLGVHPWLLGSFEPMMVHLGLQVFDNGGVGANDLRQVRYIT